MKKRLNLLILLSLLTLPIFAQTSSQNTESSSAKSLTEYGKDKPTYQLFKTTNMWTFLKLNTKNGIIYQVQYDVTGDNRGEVFLNFIPLAAGENAVNGRFTLYPTENMWTFILLDQIDGHTWQVQWSQEEIKRGIIPIS